jgi:diguanylate cyclase (GGDEF)-like protein
LRSTRSIEILCLVLAALELLWTRAYVLQPVASIALLGVFTAAIVAFRAGGFFPGRTRLRLEIESWSMLVFVTGAMWLSGRSSSPLLNLYLLPLILSALTLGRFVTGLQVLVIAACHLGFALATPGVEPWTLDYASRAVGELAPMLLVAYLTATLSADVTEARERIENLAQTDPLTGLLNQRMFNEVWQRTHSSGTAYALLMVDIDQLKTVNDAFGLEAGNEAITLVAQCLRRTIRASDHAARFGGDEFAVLLPGAGPEVADAVVKRVRNNVYKTTLDVRSRMIRCSVSIGVALHPRDARDMRDLLSIADRNMDRDKELRRSPGSPASARVPNP